MADKYETLSNAELDALFEQRMAEEARTSAAMRTGARSGMPLSEPRARITVRPPWVEETGLEQQPGVDYLAPPGVREEFPLVPTQRSAGEPGKPIAMAIGGILGSTAAMPSAAVTGPAGPIAGGALGTAGGAYAYDIYRDLMRYFTDDYTAPPSISERLMGPVSEGAWDAVLNAAVAGGPAVSAAGRAIARKALSISPEDTMLAKEALGDQFMKYEKPSLMQRLTGAAPPAPSAKIPLGIADVKYDEGPARIYLNTIGRMPFLGGPARKARTEKLAGWEREWDRELGYFGPSVDVPAISKDVIQKGKEAYSAFRGEAKTMYDEARRLADIAGPIVPSNEIITAAVKASNELVKPRPMLGTGKLMASNTPDYVLKFLDEVQQLPAQLTVGQVDWLKNELDTVARKSIKDGFKFSEALNVEKAAEKALRQINPTEPAAVALKAADDFFSRAMTTFETPTGQRFGKVDKKFFKLGFTEPGKLNEDEFYRVALNARSPQAIEDMIKILDYGGPGKGREAMGKLARRYIEDAANTARGVDKRGMDVFDVGALEKAFKLNDPKSAEYQTLAKMMSTAGVDIKDFKRLLDITKSTFGNEIPDVSGYLQRSSAMRIMAGGTAATAGLGVLGAFFPAAAASAVPAAIVSSLFARYGTKLLSSPDTLRRILKTYDSNLPTTQKRMNLLRIAQGLVGEEREMSQREKVFPKGMETGNE